MAKTKKRICSLFLKRSGHRNLKLDNNLNIQIEFEAFYDLQINNN